MKQSGQIVLVPFPFTDLSGAKLRPVLMLRRASVQFDDWLVCMVSSQLRQVDVHKGSQKLSYIGLSGHQHEGVIQHQSQQVLEVMSARS